MSATDEALAKAAVSHRLASQREVDDVRAWGQRYHPGKDVIDLLLLKGHIDRTKASFVRRVAKMSGGPGRRDSDDSTTSSKRAAVLAEDPPTATDGSAAKPAVVDPSAPTVKEPAPEQVVVRTRKILQKDPERVGRYEILERVAAGGMGIVYKARHPELDRVFAVKVLTPRVQASEEALARFQREAKIAARLDHPNIVRIYDAGTDEGAPYIVMDYVDGRSLERIIKDEGVGVRRAAQVARSLALALQHAHERDVVHRDIKPDNVIIEKESGEPKLTDFGIVKDLAGDEEDRKLTQTGFTLGSPCYMSPEQASGNHEKVGPRSDIYSLAATLYQMLTGAPPFDADSIHQIMLKVVREEPTSVRKKNPAVPLDLDSICMKALEKDPDARYASAKALADDLDRFLAEEPILAKPAGVVTKARRFARRHTGAVIVVLAFLSLLAAFAGSAVRDERARRHARLEKRDAQLAAAQAALARAADSEDVNEKRRAWYDALLSLEALLAEHPDHPAAITLKAEAVLALGDHLIESGEASFAEFVFGLGAGQADPAVIASRLEAARVGQWVESAQEAERRGELEEAARLYGLGLHALREAGYGGERLVEKLKDLERQRDARRKQDEVRRLSDLADREALAGDAVASLKAARMGLELVPGDRDLMAKAEAQRQKLLEELARLAAETDAGRARVAGVSGGASFEPVEPLLVRGDEAVARAMAARDREEWAAARRELLSAGASYAQAYGLAGAMHAREACRNAAVEAEEAHAARFAPAELGRARELQTLGEAELERGRHDLALAHFEQAASTFRQAGHMGSGKEVVAIARGEAQDVRSQASTALAPQQRLSTYRLAEADFTLAETHYQRAEYGQANDLYQKARIRFQQVLASAPVVRDAFGLRLRVKNLRVDAEANRARDFAPEEWTRGLESEATGDNALEREDATAAVTAYTDAVYRFRRAIERSAPLNQDLRACEQLRAEIAQLKEQYEERHHWKTAYRDGLEHANIGDGFFNERKFGLAQRRYERALSELRKLGDGR